MGQHGKFGELENPIGLTNEDNDFIAIFFASALTPAGRAFSVKQNGTQGGKHLSGQGGSGGSLGLPQAKRATQGHHEQRKETMDHHRRLGAFGKV